MQLRITESTWIYTSLFALSVALVTSACDDPDAVTEADLAAESVDEAMEARAPLDELFIADEAEEDAPVAAEEERRWRGDDDDDGWRWGRRDDDDDHHGRRGRHDDDDDHHRRGRDDDDDHRW